MIEPEILETPEEVAVITVVPYAEGAEYRRYTVPGEELPELLAELDRDETAEKRVKIEW